MSGFPADWLALREPLDHAARDIGLLLKLLAWRRGKGAITVIDLGSGTGANLRTLAPHLAGHQTWRLIEKDGTLLLGATRPSDLHGKLKAEPLVADLADHDLDELLDRADLVTASALMDLVAPAWFDRLAEVVARRGAALYVTLTYDGRVDLAPRHPDDQQVLALFNRHQRRDKGIGGPALGPAAPEHMVRTLEALGYRVEAADADWRLGPEHKAVMEHLVTGWAEAAREISLELATTIEAWREDRLASLRRGQLRVRVGHRDLLALP